MRKKLKDTGGLTMVEMLCAVAILVLLCLMMNTGIGMAVKTYRDITAESETDLLVSSLTDALTDKLRYAVVTEKTETVSGVVTVKERNIFISEHNDANKIDLASGAVADMAVGIEDGKVVVDTVKTTDVDGNSVNIGKQLLPKGAYGASGKFSAGYIGKYMVEKVKDDSGNEVPLVTYDVSNNSFNIKFIVKSEQTGISKTAEFTVRCLNPVKKEV